MDSKTMIKRTILFSSALILAGVLPAQAAVRMAGGQWEATMTTDGSTRTVKYCVSAAEADSLNGDSKTGRDFAEKKANGRCAIKSFDMKGDKVSSSMLCGARSIEGTTTYHGDTSEGDLTTTSEGKAVTTHIKARRLGACP